MDINETFISRGRDNQKPFRLITTLKRSASDRGHEDWLAVFAMGEIGLLLVSFTLPFKPAISKADRPTVLPQRFKHTAICILGLEWMNSNPRMQIAVIIERQIKAHIKASPALRRDYTLLTSIKSVGPQLGMHMLVVLRSHNFASAEQAAAFLGVVPIEKRSGTSVRSRPRMSKIGPPQLRAKLYMSALCGKIYNKRMRNIYDEMCLRGKPKMVAIGALMRKLVHWCYGVLKTGTVFNDESLKQVLST
jgi:hypothetical protein